MRDYDITVPRDCVASKTVNGNHRALAYLEKSLQIGTTPSRRLPLPIV